MGGGQTPALQAWNDLLCANGSSPLAWPVWWPTSRSRSVTRSLTRFPPTVYTPFAPLLQTCALWARAATLPAWVGEPRTGRRDDAMHDIAEREILWSLGPERFFVYPLMFLAIAYFFNGLWQHIRLWL